MSEGTPTAASEAPAEDTKPTGGEAVLRMRDEFVKLAQCYLEMHQYADAQRAAAMAESLTKFEDEHIITNIEWPPRVETDEYSCWLAGNTDTRPDR